MKHSSNMKFSLVAILVAFLCATVVSGAPSTPSVSFQELALSEAFNVGENFGQWGDQLKCAISILDNELVGDLESLWEKSKTELDALLSKWEKCSSAGSVIEQITCRTDVVTRTITIVNEIISQLRKELDPKKLKEIQQKIVNQCLKGNSFDSSEEADEDEDVEEFAAGSLPEQFQCFVDVLGEVSKRNGLDELWSRTQPQLQLHIDNWKGCAQIGNKFARFLCNAKEGAYSYQIIMEYIRLVAGVKPLALIDFARQAQQKCNSYQTFEDLMEIDEAAEYGIISGTIEKLDCILNALTEAVIGTELAKPWEKLSKDVKQYMNNIVACKDQPTDWSEAKCVISEAAKAYRVVFNFLSNVRKLNRELYDNIKIQIKNRCYK